MRFATFLRHRPGSRALPAVISLAVLVGLLLGVITMNEHHAAHHGVAAVAPAAQTMHSSHMHHAMHAPPPPVQQDALVTASSGDSQDTPGQIVLQLCLAVLFGVGGFFVLRVVLAAWRHTRSLTSALRLFLATAVGPRPRSSGPPGRATLTRLCVLRH